MTSKEQKLGSNYSPIIEVEEEDRVMALMMRTTEATAISSSHERSRQIDLLLFVCSGAKVGVFCFILIFEDFMHDNNVFLNKPTLFPLLQFLHHHFSLPSSCT